MAGVLAPVVMLLAGLWFVRGGDKRLVVTSPAPTAFFALAWLGGGWLLLTVGGMLSPDEPGPLVKVVLAAVLAVDVTAVVIGLVGIVWLPTRLCPTWYRDWVHGGRRQDAFNGPEHWTPLRRWAIGVIRRNEERHERRRQGRP